MGIAIVGVCIALVVIALGLGVRWSHHPFVSPPTVEAPTLAEVGQRDGYPLGDESWQGELIPARTSVPHLPPLHTSHQVLKSHAAG